MHNKTVFISGHFNILRPSDEAEEGTREWLSDKLLDSEEDLLVAVTRSARGIGKSIAGAFGLRGPNWSFALLMMKGAM